MLQSKNVQYDKAAWQQEIVFCTHVLQYIDSNILYWLV